MNILIKEFSDDLAPRLSELIKDNLELVNSNDYEEKIINNMVDYFNPEYIKDISEVRNIYVAEHNNKIVGTASLDKNTVYTVFVDPEYHGQGIGKKLMDYIEKVAKKKNIPLLKVPASITSVKFYKKLGYVKVGEKTLDGFGKNVIMKKELK